MRKERSEERSRYYDLVHELDAKLSQADGDPETARMRSIAKEEVNKTVRGLAVVGLVIYWFYDWMKENPTLTVLLVSVVFPIGWVSIWIYREARKKGGEPGSIVRDARTFAQMETLAAMAAAGERVWFVRDPTGEYPAKVDTAASNQWDLMSKRTYETALRFRNMSPRERRKEIVKAGQRAKPALDDRARLILEYKADAAMLPE